LIFVHLQLCGWHNRLASPAPAPSVHETFTTAILGG
jgi:hypothetical protein